MFHENKNAYMIESEYKQKVRDKFKNWRKSENLHDVLKDFVISEKNIADIKSVHDITNRLEALVLKGDVYGFMEFMQFVNQLKRNIDSANRKKQQPNSYVGNILPRSLF